MTEVNNTMGHRAVKVYQGTEEAPSGYAEKVIQKTIGEIRTFLDELANGTSNYKSLHNLTEQVEHQYHGRFLVELIQNAHDALFDIEKEKADKEGATQKSCKKVAKKAGLL